MDIELREYRKSDYENFKKLVTDESVMAKVDGPLPLAVVEKIFNLVTEGGEGFNDLAWAIVARGSGDYLGHGALIDRKDGTDSREVIFYICQDAWGKGVGKKAAKALLDKGMANNFKNITATVDDDHHPSIRILESLGFEFEKMDEEDGIKFRHYSFQS